MSANIEELVKKHMNESDWYNFPEDSLREVLTEQAEAFKGELQSYDGVVRELTKTVEDMRAAQSVPVLSVWYGAMPETNGKSNWTAILHNGDFTTGFTIARSEYPDRVRYEADRVRFLIGELKGEPCILDYDAEKHSDYVDPQSVPVAVTVVGEPVAFEAGFEWARMLTGHVHDGRDVCRTLTAYFWPAELRGIEVDGMATKEQAVVQAKAEIMRRLSKPAHSITAGELATLREKAAEADELRGKAERSECDIAAAVAEGDRLMRSWQEQIRKTCVALKQRNDAEKERDELRKALLALKEDCQTSNDCQYGTLSTSHVARIVDAAIAQGKGE